MQKELRSGIINFGSWFMVFLNFWLVVITVERFLKMVVVVINVLARGASWWLVVARVLF